MALSIEKHKQEAKIVSQKLACSLEVTLQLLRITARLQRDQYDLLRTFVSPYVDSENETGWEESTLASVQHLLKSLSAAKQSQAVGTTKMQELTDTTKLKANLQ